MLLESGVRQREFRNIYQKTIVNLLSTHNAVVSKINEQFRKFDISRQQYTVLRILSRQKTDCVSISVIKESMLDRMSDASRIVERLRQKGLVLRGGSLDDKRAVCVSITEKGKELLNRMEGASIAIEDFLHKLSEEEADLLNQLLDKICS